MASFVHALKERVVGVVEENVGYLVGNSEMETRGREKKEHGAEEAATFYEKSGNISSPRNPEGTSFEASDSTSTTEQKQEEATSTSSSSTSFTPSLFYRNQPDPENSTHGAMKDKMHSETIRVSSSDTNEKPVVAPIQTQEKLNEARNVQPLPERKDEPMSWMDKLGAIMGGTKDDETSLLPPDEIKNDEKEESVMERLRNAHAEAVAQQEKGVTETIKEKFDNWNKSANSMFSGQDTDRGFTETVQEKIEESGNSTLTSQETPLPDPLLVKPTPVGDPAEIPDPNFLQNA